MGCTALVMILSRLTDYFHLLNTDKFIYGGNVASNFQAKHGGLSDFFQRIRNCVSLGVAAFQRRHGRDIRPVFALFN